MQQEKLKVVLDTNIIISAAVSIEGTPARIFEMLIDKRIKNYITNEILEEIIQVINRPYFREMISNDYREFIISTVVSSSILIEPKFNEKVSEHSNDDKFLNCALTAKANIISGDQHLLKIKGFRDVRVFSASEFIQKCQKK